MIPYASNTGTRRNLAAMLAADWRILLTPAQPKPRPGMKYGVDNGAWRSFQQKEPFDGAAFERLVERAGAGADFVVIPDIVAGGMESLEFSLSWLPKLQHLRQLLLPVQDGMEAVTIGKVLKSYPKIGIFLGGSTNWKLETIYAWGLAAHCFERWYHVGRVNTARRVRLCAEAGATSFDGSSASRYCETLPLI